MVRAVRTIETWEGSACCVPAPGTGPRKPRVHQRPQPVRLTGIKGKQDTKAVGSKARQKRQHKWGDPSPMPTHRCEDVEIVEAACAIVPARYSHTGHGPRVNTRVITCYSGYHADNGVGGGGGEGASGRHPIAPTIHTQFKHTSLHCMPPYAPAKQDDAALRLHRAQSVVLAGGGAAHSHQTEGGKTDKGNATTTKKTCPRASAREGRVYSQHASTACSHSTYSQHARRRLPLCACGSHGTHTCIQTPRRRQPHTHGPTTHAYPAPAHTAPPRDATRRLRK